MASDQYDLPTPAARSAPEEALDAADQTMHPAGAAAGPLKTPVSRGRLLRLTGSGLKAGAAAYVGIQALSRAGTAAAAGVKPPQGETGTIAQAHHLPLRFFNDAQAAVITAMAERVFPADKTGPGATDLHVLDYIDGQLAAGYGWGERMYLQGPFYAPESSGHGWQVPMTPRDVYQTSLAALDQYCETTYKNSYDQLSAKDQDAVLMKLSGSSNVSTPPGTGTGTSNTGGSTQQGNNPTNIAGSGGTTPASGIPGVSDQFWALFYEHVKEGLFADPIYGGNYNMGGWKLVKFPGNPMAYGDQYGYYIDQPTYFYNPAPKSLADQAD